MREAVAVVLDAESMELNNPLPPLLERCGAVCEDFPFMMHVLLRIDPRGPEEDRQPARLSIQKKLKRKQEDCLQRSELLQWKE